MFTSAKRLEANRRNAQKSTGPKTPEGKAKSCLNSARHSLLSRQVVIQGHKITESSEEFEALSREYYDHLAPVGPMEEMLVDKIITTLWRLRRVRTAESAEIARSVDTAWWDRKRQPHPAVIWGQWRLIGNPTHEMKETALGNSVLVKLLSELHDAVQQDGELTQQAFDNFTAILGDKADALSLRVQNYWDKLLKTPENLDPAVLRERNKQEMLDFLLMEMQKVARGVDQCRVRESKIEEASHAAAVLPPDHTLSKILRYEAALEKQLFTAMAQLERLQDRRLAQNSTSIETTESPSEAEEVEITKRTHFENEKNPIESMETATSQ